MRTFLKLALVVLMSFTAGCSWFGDDDEPEEIKPNPCLKSGRGRFACCLE